MPSGLSSHFNSFSLSSSCCTLQRIAASSISLCPTLQAAMCTLSLNVRKLFTILKTLLFLILFYNRVWTPHWARSLSNLSPTCWCRGALPPESRDSSWYQIGKHAHRQRYWYERHTHRFRIQYHASSYRSPFRGLPWVPCLCCAGVDARHSVSWLL